MNGVCVSGRATSTVCGSRWTDQGKRNTYFLSCFLYMFKDWVFRGIAPKCSQSSSHSLPFVHAWTPLSWHRWLLRFSTARWHSSQGSAPPQLLSPSTIPLAWRDPSRSHLPRSALPGLLQELSPLQSIDSRRHVPPHLCYQPLPSSTMVWNWSSWWFMALEAIVLSANALILSAWVIGYPIVLSGFYFVFLEMALPSSCSLPWKLAKFYKRVIISCSHSEERGFDLFWSVVWIFLFQILAFQCLKGCLWTPLSYWEMALRLHAAEVSS